MAEKSTKRYMELQMEELKTTYGVDEEVKEPAPKKSTSGREEDLEIAQLYEDAWEYEEELKSFEDELHVIKTNELKNMVASLVQAFPEEERDFARELKAVAEAGWTHFALVEQTRPKAQLALIRESEFSDIARKLTEAFPDDEGDFEADVKAVLIKRWETLIAIKEEHIKEEITEIKTAGLKPSYAKRIYKRYHGID